MKKLIFLTLSCLLPFASIRASGSLPDDQLLVIYGSSGYVLYKVLDFANDHGFRYIKILSYEFTGFDHTILGRCQGEPKGGSFFELKDKNASISFLCYEKKPDDIYTIDLYKYRSLLDDIASEMDE